MPGRFIANFQGTRDRPPAVGDLDTYLVLLTDSSTTFFSVSFIISRDSCAVLLFDIFRALRRSGGHLPGGGTE